MRCLRTKPRKIPKHARGWEIRERFLDAAARVFSRYGYAAGTTNRIAAEAGASVGSLYQYFPNKDSILVALVRRHVDEGARVLADRLAGTASMPLLERLGVLVDAVLENHAGDPRLHQVLFEEAPRPPALLEELHALEASITAATEEMLRDDPAVAVDDPAMAARLVVMSVESLIHRYVSGHHDRLELDSFRHELLTMHSRYLRGGAPAARPASAHRRPDGSRPSRRGVGSPE
jgi:AcrR family transcriptional regulator